MDLSLLFPLLILLLFIPIFLSGRRQRRQMAETQALQQSLENGDVVVTTSGLRGTVIDASYEDTVDLEIADGVVTTWLRAAIREKVTHHDPVEEPTVIDSSPAPVAPADPTPDASPSLDKAPSLEKDDSANGSSRN
ncbi:preprotein translocase subunit YajC [Pseudonocardia sp. CA-142604]|uniref:preprotein translocase subunit YajC n=1 Tax=Pseudonocardia sp. CA-142604 TaxID=3240024 RepID=UPI003D8B3207